MQLMPYWMLLLRVVHGSAEVILENLAYAAQRRALGRGHPPGRPLQRWRSAISACVVKSAVAAIRSSQFSLVV